MALKIFEASRRLAAITAQFTAAGLDIEQFITAADDSALKAHLDSLKGDASLAEQLTAAQAQVSAFSSQVSTYTAALSAVGVQPKAADEKAGLTAADIEQAVRARASVMASEQLGKHGLAAPLPVAPSADSTKPGQKSNEKTRAEFFQLSPQARLDFSKQGGRLID